MNKLTEDEVLVLSEKYNLADGHAFRKWNSAEHEIINNISKIFHSVDRRNQKNIETEYLNNFLDLCKQSKRPDYFNFSLCFTASTALEVIANYLRIHQLTVALIEPCFDNLYDILNRHNIPLTSFPESMMNEKENVFTDYLQQLSNDAIFLVSPNNPTGTHIKKENFTRLVEYCYKEDKILILDTCFRLYLPDEEIYDQYQILADSNVKCIIIEDTGKTWPTLELKAPFFSVSPQLSDIIGNIYSDFLLHVSPISVKLMDEFLKIDNDLGLKYIHNLIHQNRNILYREIKETFLEPTENEYMSVSWLKIKASISSSELKKILSNNGIHVLAGYQFFWSNPEQGDCFIRIALNRDPEMFQNAVRELGIACKILKREIENGKSQ